tara:strand:- start:260 stop:421 length:162 start_codon:yes stop_codon:yes gene_type:complete
MRDIFIMICLLLTSCTYQVDNCHITPKVNAEDVDITKPLQEQVQPEANVVCSY